MHRESHSMYQELQVNTSECNLQKFLDQISVPLSGVCPFFHHKLLYEHLFDILIIEWYSKMLHWLWVLVRDCQLSPWSWDLNQYPSMNLGLDMIHWSSFHHFPASIPSSCKRNLICSFMVRFCASWCLVDRIYFQFFIKNNGFHPKLLWHFGFGSDLTWFRIWSHGQRMMLWFFFFSFCTTIWV